MHTPRLPRALAALTALTLALTIAPVSGAWAAPTVLGTCIIVENPTIDNHTNCPGADLSFSVGWASDLNLDYANFAGADLTDSPLIIESASHKHLNLDGATLDGVPLVELDLTTSSMAGASMVGTVMVGANLSGLDLSGNDLTGAVGVDGNFTGADLSGAALTGSTFINAVLAGANLAGADFTDAAVLQADFSGANLTGVVFGGAANTMDANFTGANLTDALWSAAAYPTGGGIFDGATLTRTQLPAGLGGSSWRGTDATTATFAAETDLGGSDWTDANLSGQHFNGVRLGGSDLLRANLAGITIEAGSQFEAGGVNFTEANLSGVLFLASNLTDAILPPAKNLYGWDAQKWLYGIFIENTTLTGTSLDIDDLAVLAPTPDSYPVSWDVPPAFANTDGQLPWGSSYDGGYWWGTRYTCDHDAGDIFPLGVTTVTCDLTIDHSTGIEPWQQPDRFDIANARHGYPEAGESGIGIHTGLGAQTFTAVPRGSTLVDLEDFINTDSAARHGPVFFPTEAGIYTTSTTSFTVTINAAPTLTGNAGNGAVGETYSAVLNAAGFPAPSFLVTSGGLPAGITLNADGTLTGTPEVGSGGQYVLEVTATNTHGSAELELAFAITEPLPAITPGLASTGAGEPTPALTLGLVLLAAGSVLATLKRLRTRCGLRSPR